LRNGSPRDHVQMLHFYYSLNVEIIVHSDKFELLKHSGLAKEDTSWVHRHF